MKQRHFSIFQQVYTFICYFFIFFRWKSHKIFLDVKYFYSRTFRLSHTLNDKNMKEKTQENMTAKTKIAYLG